jgi:ABC-type antimicrobial peptide transport system permease subunit
MGSARHLVLPAVNLTFWSSARLSRLTRSAMIEVLKEDYIRTARSKGLSETAVYAHAIETGHVVALLDGGTRAAATAALVAWCGRAWIAGPPSLASAGE